MSFVSAEHQAVRCAGDIHPTSVSGFQADLANFNRSEDFPNPALVSLIVLAPPELQSSLFALDEGWFFGVI